LYSTHKGWSVTPVRLHPFISRCTSPQSGNGRTTFDGRCSGNSRDSSSGSDHPGGSGLRPAQVFRYRPQAPRDRSIALACGLQPQHFLRLAHGQPLRRHHLSGFKETRRKLAASEVQVIQRRTRSPGVAGFRRNGRPECPEWVAGFDRNGWPACSGMGGRIRPEYAVIGLRTVERGAPSQPTSITRAAWGPGVASRATPRSDQPGLRW
jgi:hypothetical protein